MSTGLSYDASSAYHRFRRRARTLGRISGSFDALARSMAAGYLTALTRPAPEVWATLVARTALLVRYANALPEIVALDAKEREALDFFEAIVRENADLLAMPDPVTAGLNLEAPRRESVPSSVR